MNNQYLALYKMMSEATKVEPSFFIAKIKSPFPNLQVQLNDIVLDKDDLLIDKWIFDRNKDLYSENTICEISHKHQIMEPIQDKLNIDDKVILLRIGDKFILISKVVAI